MLPTTYRGDAIIEGERVSGVLHLSSDSIRLTLDNNQEVLRWPIGDIAVDTTGKGAYELRNQHETFMFEPSMDDGLGDEISLRRRFFVPAVEYAKPDPPSRLSPESETAPQPPPAAPPAPTESIADRVAAAGRHSDGKSLFVAGGDRFRRYLLAGSLGLILVVMIAIAVTVVTTERPATLEAAVEPAPTTVPAPTTAPAPLTSAEPVPTTVAPTTPPTVAAATVTTSPPASTAPAPAAGSVFEITPSELTERWDTAALGHNSSLVSENVQEEGDEFGFDAGPFVRLQGSVDGGTVTRIAFVGDPSGTVEDDREVLTALGLTLSLVEPRLPPEGRRELLLALGFDVEDPDLAGLDNSLDYRGHTYWLRWDTSLERIVLDVRPAT